MDKEGWYFVSEYLKEVMKVKEKVPKNVPYTVGKTTVKTHPFFFLTFSRWSMSEWHRHTLYFQHKTNTAAGKLRVSGDGTYYVNTDHRLKCRSAWTRCNFCSISTRAFKKSGARDFVKQHIIVGHCDSISGRPFRSAHRVDDYGFVKLLAIRHTYFIQKSRE